MKSSDIIECLPHLFAAKISVFIKGASGVGKSAVVQQLGKKLGVEVRDTMRASQMDPTDIKGFPSPDPKKNLMRWLPPNFLPQDPKSRGILFLDELTAGSVAVQAAMYQLFLDRRVGDYVLPEDWAIVSAGNREIDRSIVNRMPAALANRVQHIDYEVDTEDFVTWGMKEGLSATTLGFIRFQEDLLHKFEPTSSEAAFPSPRSWVKADKIIQMPLSPMLQLELLNGQVGTGAAAQFFAYASMVNELPTKEEIAMDPLRAPVPESPGAQYAVTTMLSLATENADHFRTNLQYMERLSPEFQVVYVRDLLNAEIKIKGTKEWTTWCMANKDVVL